MGLIGPCDLRHFAVLESPFSGGLEECSLRAFKGFRVLGLFVLGYVVLFYRTRLVADHQDVGMLAQQFCDGLAGLGWQADEAGNPRPGCVC